MTTFTFFDLMAAQRQIRELSFQEPSQTTIAVPVTVEVFSRTARTWKIIGTTGVFIWDESNSGAVVISETGSRVRMVAHFGYFDLVAAMRQRRTLKFTTGGNDVLAIPTSVMNTSRTSNTFVVATSNGTFIWVDNNAGGTVISEV